MTGATSARLLNDGWVFREQDPEEIPHSDLSWLPAVVPGHVHLDLQRAGVIADPFERMHERGVQWVDECGWTYRLAFEVDARELDGARHVLRFDGLDTLATVFLNDAEVGRFEDMFIAHEVDVSDALRVGTNVLEVRFDSAERVGAALTSATLALSVVLSLQDADARWSENAFHLLPGEPREVTVTSPDGLTYDELVAAVRWRAL